jgi:hypothetical protein
LDTTEVDKLVNKAIDEAVSPTTAPSPVIEQMSNVLAKKPAPSKKPVKPQSLEEATPVPVPSTKAPESLLQQTGEALPPSLPKKDVLDTLYDDLYTNKPAVTTTRPFPEEAYVKGKADLIDTFGAKYIDDIIKNDPKDYANMLHVYAGDTLGLKKGKGLPPLPYEVADTAIVKYDDMGNPIPVGQIEKKTAGNVVPEQEVQYSGEYLVGELDNKVFKHKTTRERQDALAEIKDERTRSFNTLKKNKLMENIDGDVVAVAQGEFRAKYKREVDPSSDKAITAFAELANSLQKKYDTLKEKYKDTPPIKLFHGNYDVEGIKSTGFSDPQKFYNSSHSELRIGGPSFTKDIGLGAQGGRFGGSNPENYLYTEMPYADYMFKRINMSTEAYTAKDINVIARTLTGSPDTVRPLSLPRNDFNETEDVIVEAEKLKTQGKGKMRLKPATEELTRPIREGGEGKLQTTLDRREKFSKNRELLRDYMTLVDDNYASSLKERRKAAYLTYDLIKEISNDLLGAAESVSTKKGLGHTYQTDMTRFANQIASTSKIGTVINVLEDMGAVQKAAALKNIRNKLNELSSVSGEGSDKITIKALNETREAGRKLAKGGFINKR